MKQLLLGATLFLSSCKTLPEPLAPQLKLTLHWDEFEHDFSQDTFRVTVLLPDSVGRFDHCTFGRVPEQSPDSPLQAN